MAQTKGAIGQLKPEGAKRPLDHPVKQPPIFYSKKVLFGARY